MKTIRDLVDRLNKCYGMTCRVEELAGCYSLEDDLSAYVHFNNGNWDILTGFCILHHEVQKEIMDFIYTTNSKYWFDEPENKYNIVIGQYLGNFMGWKSAYKKTEQGVKVWNVLPEKDLVNDDFMFTESEVEKLKSALPENMAEIVELGKVEIKDED